MTTATYTGPAIDLARRHKIELIDGGRLAELLLEFRGPSEGDDAAIAAGELAARGIYDPRKIELPHSDVGLIPGVPGGALLIVEEVVAIGLPKECESCDHEMMWMSDPVGWRCNNCGESKTGSRRQI